MRNLFTSGALGAVAFLLCVALELASAGPSQCLCPATTTGLLQPNIPQVSAPVQISSTNETINGVDIGKLVVAAGQTWQADVQTASKSQATISTKCPTSSGFRVPTRVELQSLADLGYDILTDPAGLALNNTRIYVSSEKVYPTLIDGTKNTLAYNFYALVLDAAARTAIVTNVSTNSQSSKISAKCVRDVKDMSKLITVAGLTDDLLISTGNTLSLTGFENANKIQLSYSDVPSQEGRSVRYTPSARIGCYSLWVSVELFGGEIISKCFTYWTTTSLDYLDTCSLVINGPQDFQNANYTDATYSRSSGVDFSSQSTPITAKLDSGFYMLYATQPDGELFVKEFASDLTVVRNISLGGRKGSPFDIVATPQGFACLIRDKTDRHYLYLLHVNSYASRNGTVKWSKTIMKNGNQPTKASNQITFYDNDDPSKSPLFGMFAMYDPSSGRLSYGRGRIAALFAHYNYFGASGGSHTGDTSLTFDSEDPNDVKLANNWGASHSLVQRLGFDREQFFSAALSDAFPQNIKYTRFTSGHTLERNQLRLSYKESNSLIPGNIEGNGGGESGGRLGGLIRLDGDRFMNVYSRWNMSKSYYSNVTNSVSELGILVYNATPSFNRLLNKALFPYNDVNGINAAKYGPNILILFARQNTVTGDFRIGDLSATGHKMYMLVIDWNGTVQTGPTEMPFAMTPTDDIDTLVDGSLIWAYVDSGKLALYRLPPPSSSTCAAPLTTAITIDPPPVYVAPPPAGSSSSLGVSLLAAIAISILAFL